MNELQIDNLRILDESYSELKETTIDTIDTVVLLEKLNFMDTTAIAIRDWSKTLSDYYYAKKAEIEADETGSVYINFDEVELMPYTMDELKDSQKGNMTSDYKIAQYVDIPFIDSKIDRVDFSRDLKLGTVVNKTVLRVPNGRPEKVEYRINGELVAIIYITFETQGNNLIYKRIETLVYIKKDDTDGINIKIKEKIFDMTNPDDRAAIVKERKQSRQFIFDDIQAFVNGVLLQYHPDKSQYQILDMIEDYMKASEQLIKSFVDRGMEYWEENLGALPIPVTDPSCLWLNYVFDANTGATIKDYMIAKLSY